MKDLATTEDVYSWLHDPLKTDTRLLDLMAKEAGVKDWFFDDSELAKRQSIDLAHQIMQKAGTRTGLKDALEALGLGAIVSKGEQKYSLNISAEVPDGALSPELYSRINQRIQNYKSERDSVSMETVRGSTSVISVGVMCETGIVSDSNPYTFEQIDSIAAFRIGVLAETYIICDSEAAIQ